MDTPSPELKQLWIRVLKRVHPDLAIDEQDRMRCERLTTSANEAYQAGDLEALRAVLTPQPPTLHVPPGSAFSFKQLLPFAIVVLILICGGFSLYSVTTSQHSVTNGPTAQVPSVNGPIKAHMEAGQPPPSKWYGDVIHNRISRNLNPSTLVNTPPGATAVIAFTISREGSPQSVSLVTSSWYPSLDFSCVNAVRQVRTFGPPEGGTKDSLNVIYDCSYHQQGVQQVHQETVPVVSAPVASSAKPSHLYMKQMAERLQQNFRSYELVDANVPAGNSGELWFDVNRDGSLSNVRIGKPSGWNSLDYACIRAVQRTPTVGALPEEYKLRTLPASFACAYSGSNARASRSVDAATERSGLDVGSVRNPTRQ
ncbi:MAG: energy transducer TonB [Acidobacteriaceae bacterium]